MSTAQKKKQSPSNLACLIETEIPWLHQATLKQACGWYDECLHLKDWTDDLTAELGRRDRFFLLAYLLNRPDVVHPWIYARIREVEANPDGYLDLWSREHYKDLADDTPMLTSNRGWVTHGELKKGDSVFAPDGNPVRVLAVTEQYTDSACYRVTFQGGASLIAGSGHLWKLHNKHKHRIGKTDAREVRWSHSVVETSRLMTDRRRDVGVSSALIYQEADLPIPPYVLGAWLGDGTSSIATITCAYSDIEIIQRIRACGVVVYERKSSNQNTGLFTLDTGLPKPKTRSMTAKLRALGVLNNKHIPLKYMTASNNQRMELLRGLMDTDGHCSTRGTATFCQVSEALANQVFDLAVSLGLRPGISVKRENGGKGFYQVRMQAHKDRNPFGLGRKAARAINPSRHRNVRRVTAVKRVASVPTRCIQVDGGMYLAGRTLIPTHNSTIITYAGSIQEIIKNPEITVGIFSHNRSIAKKFLRQIKREFEANEVLKALYPEILWGNPEKESPKWSEDDGLIVRRKTNPGESTVEAWGLVDGQPIGKHFGLLVFDDVVTDKSVYTPDQIMRTTESWELAQFLGSGDKRKWHVGTRYNFADTYGQLIDRGAVIPRVYAATDDGLPDGKPVLLTKEQWDKLKRESSASTLACQMLLNPIAGNEREFLPEWLRQYEVRPHTLNVYILGDYAGSRQSTGSSRTALIVIGVDSQLNKYLLDGAVHKMGLEERWRRIRDMRKHWLKEPGVQVVEVGYERFGAQSDIEHFQTMMNFENESFEIKELAWPRDGDFPKDNRIRRLIPDLKNWRFFFPYDGEGPTKRQIEAKANNMEYLVAKPIKQKDENGKLYALMEYFVRNEYMFFPATTAKDMLDAMSRLYDMEVTPPMLYDENDILPAVTED